MQKLRKNSNICYSTYARTALFTRFNSRKIPVRGKKSESREQVRVVKRIGREWLFSRTAFIYIFAAFVWMIAASTLHKVNARLPKLKEKSETPNIGKGEAYMFKHLFFLSVRRFYSPLSDGAISGLGQVFPGIFSHSLRFGRAKERIVKSEDRKYPRTAAEHDERKGRRNRISHLSLHTHIFASIFFWLLFTSGAGATLPDKVVAQVPVQSHHSSQRSEEAAKDKAQLPDSAPVYRIRAAATREKLFFSLYKVGVYSEPAQNGGKDSEKGSKFMPQAFVVDILYDGSLPNAIPSSWKEELMPVLGKTQTETIKEKYASLKAGDKIKAYFVPEQGSFVLINDELVLQDDTRALIKAFTELWLGDNPVSSSLKSQLSSSIDGVSQEN